MKTNLITSSVASLLLSACPLLWANDPAFSLSKVGEYQSGVFDGSAAEIAAFDAESKRLFVTNSGQSKLDILSLEDLKQPTKLHAVDLAPWGAPNSVAVYQGLVAVALENKNKQEKGLVVFLDIQGNELGTAEVGFLPDMLCFSPDGKTLLVANEGEPNKAYDVDPEGSISIIDLSQGVGNLSTQHILFTHILAEDLDPSVRIFGPNASVAQDLEPEYITFSKEGSTAWVTLQENNALAIVDVLGGELKGVVGLGFKDHSLAINGFDASNKDGKINIQSWPVKGMYLPDAIASFTVKGETYLVTANEGDSRDYEGFSEEARVGKVKLDADAFPAAETLQNAKNLGRLKITTTLGDTDGDGDFDEIYAYGARSFSVWNAEGALVYDSGDFLERTLAELLPENFNATHDENGSFDDRSDDKGPEPEGLVIGNVNGRPVLFLGLERVGGIMAFDLSDPAAPAYLTYVNSRDFAGIAKDGNAGDLAPEGLVFIPASDSPNGKNLLVVSYEVSGSVAIFEIN